MINKLLIVMVFLLFLIAGKAYAQQDSLDFPAPQYMLPFYDHFSRNHLNAEAMGRGFTTNAMLGGVESAVFNPAALKVKEAAVFLELVVKPPIGEINIPESMRYLSPYPWGMIGISGNVTKNLQGAVSYNVPKSVESDNFSVIILQGNSAVTRYPAYYLHQITSTLTGQYENLRMGLNLHQQLHQFKDIIVFHSFEKIDRTYYILRIQPGMMYKAKNYRIGATFTLPATKEMSIKFDKYDTTLPMKISGGFAADFAKNKVTADVEWEQFSKMTPEFSDRITLRGGLERRVRNLTYRAGIMYKPSVYEGPFKLPANENATPDQQFGWRNVNQGGYIDETDQLLLTMGFTYHFKGGKLVMGLMRDVLDNVPLTQMSMAVSVNLEAFKGRKFLIFD